MLNIKIDSLKLRIDLRHVEVLDKVLTDNFAFVNATTGELPEDEEGANKTFRRSRKQIIVDGCKYSFHLRKYQFAGVLNEYLVVNIHSKMLRKRLFEGITYEALEQIHKDITGLGVVKFSYHTFLYRSRVTDVDFCLDFKCSENEYKNFVKKMKSLTPFSPERERGYKCYYHGLEWNTRQTADNSNPYIKTYNKEVEMRQRFGKYLDFYVTEENLKNLRRFEFTVKDANHFLSFNIKDCSLAAVVLIEPSLRVQMMKTVTRKVLKVNSPLLLSLLTEDELKPRQKFYLKMMQYMHQKGESFESMLQYLTSTMNKGSRSVYKKDLQGIYNRFVQGLDVNEQFIGKNPVLEIIFSSELATLD